MSVAGNLVTLTGQMTGTSRYEAQGRTYTAAHDTRFSIRQGLKLRIVGQTCQVLEYIEETREEKIGTISSRNGTNPTHSVTITRVTAGAGAKCAMTRRSAPVAESDDEDELIPFDGLCGDR